MIKKLFLVMGLLGLFSVCKGQENAEQPATMPQGKLLRVKYDFSGMRMAGVSRRLDAMSCPMAKGYAESRSCSIMLPRPQQINP
jgi:hypothetical protein